MGENLPEGECLIFFTSDVLLFNQKADIGEDSVSRASGRTPAARLTYFTANKNNTMNIPENLYYTEDHEWIRLESDGIAYVGITDYAQSELDELVYVEVETVGETLSAGEEFGTVEAVKTTSELLMPVAGTILEFNAQLDESDGDNPTLVNESPYGDGWIIKIEVADVAEVKALMNAAAYKELIG